MDDQTGFEELKSTIKEAQSAGANSRLIAEIKQAAFDGKTTLSINRNFPALDIVSQCEKQGISVAVLKNKVIFDWSNL